MRDLLLEALSAAMIRLKADVDLVTVENVNEFTFRFLAMVELARRGAKLQTEWNPRHSERPIRVDLLAQRGTDNAVIEFKFYVIRPRLDLNGLQTGWKGGARSRNQGEFQTLVDRLRNFRHPDVNHRSIVLAYETSTSKCNPSFSSVYDDLERFGVKLNEVSVVHHSFAEMACKLIVFSGTDDERECGSVTSDMKASHVKAVTQKVEQSIPDDDWANWELALKRKGVSNPAILSFFQREISANRDCNRNSLDLYFSCLSGTRRWFVRARKKWSYVWQYARFDGDIKYWQDRLSHPEMIEEIKKGRCLSFRLYTAEDFESFRQPTENQQSVRWFADSAGDETGVEI